MRRRAGCRGRGGRGHWRALAWFGVMALAGCGLFEASEGPDGGADDGGSEEWTPPPPPPPRDGGSEGGGDGTVPPSPPSGRCAALELLWARRFGEAEREVVHDVSVGPAGEVAVVGEVYRPHPDPCGAMMCPPADSWDAFVQRFEPDGTPGWERLFAGSQKDGAFAAHYTDAGDLLVGGSFQGRVDFGDQVHNVARPGDVAFYLALLPDGRTRWSWTAWEEASNPAVRAFAGRDGTGYFFATTVRTGVRFEPSTEAGWLSGPTSPSAAPAGRVPFHIGPHGLSAREDAVSRYRLAFGGSFEGQVALSVQSRGSVMREAFVSDGAQDAIVTEVPYWVWQIGSDGIDRIHAVAGRDRGGLYAAGMVGGPRANYRGATSAHDTEGPSDGFVAALGPTGALRWIHFLEGAGSAEVRDVAELPGGLVLAVGDFGGELQVGEGVTGSRARQDGLVRLLDASGRELLTATLPATSRVEVTALAVDRSDPAALRFAVAGHFEGELELAEDQRLSAAGRTDGFVALYRCAEGG